MFTGSDPRLFVFAQSGSPRGALPDDQNRSRAETWE